MSGSWPHGLQPTRLFWPCHFPGRNTGVGCPFLLQGIFLTQESNPALLYCRLYRWSYTESKSRCEQQLLLALSLDVHTSPLVLPTRGAAKRSPFSWSPQRPCLPLACGFSREESSLLQSVIATFLSLLLAQLLKARAVDGVAHSALKSPLDPLLLLRASESQHTCVPRL